MISNEALRAPAGVLVETHDDATALPQPISNEGSQAWLEAAPAQLVEGINSDDPTHQLAALTQIRKLLSISTSPPIAEVIAAGLVPRFVQFLVLNPMLQFEAACALTNIASGTSEHTRKVISNGAVPIFVQLLTSPHDDVREQAVWALGNIAGDSPETRDLVLSHRVLAPLLQQLNPKSKISMLRNATWTLANLCRGKPQPAWHMLAPALPVLAQLVFSHDDEVLADSCWALSYLSDGSNDQIQAVLDTGICARIVELMGHPLVSVQTPALRTAGNMATGNDSQKQCVINCGALARLFALVRAHPFDDAPCVLATSSPPPIVATAGIIQPPFHLNPLCSRSSTRLMRASARRCAA
jgi:hypothetical protein